MSARKGASGRPPSPASPVGRAPAAWCWARLLAGLWWGGVTALAFVAVPMLFARLGSPALAGPVAASLFSVVCWLTAVSAGGLLFFLMKYCPLPLYPYRKFAIKMLILALVAAVLQQGVVAAQIVGARASGGNLALWHGLGSLLVGVQWACAVATAWWLNRGGPPGPDRLHQSAA